LTLDAVSFARQELAAINEQLAITTIERDACQAQIDQLGEPVRQLAELMRRKRWSALMSGWRFFLNMVRRSALYRVVVEAVRESGLSQNRCRLQPQA